MASLLLTALVAVLAPAPNKHIIVVAHRAAHESAPQNSLAAIKDAIRIGCDYVELDVRTTKDGALVLMHDRTVNRTTNGEGEVSAMTKDEVGRLRLKSDDGKLWPDERVPTFDEALGLCRSKMHVYVDNKSGPPAKVIDAIERHGMLDRVVIYDGESSLREFKRLRPNVWIMPDHPDSPDEMRRLAAELKPETVDGNIRRWTAEQVTAAHAAGIQVWVDNLGENDNEAGWKKSVEMGVEAIQTDHPAALLAFLQRAGLRRRGKAADLDSDVVGATLLDLALTRVKNSPINKSDLPFKFDIRSAPWHLSSGQSDLAFNPGLGPHPSLTARTISELRGSLRSRNNERKAFQGLVVPASKVRLVDSAASDWRPSPYDRSISSWIPGYTDDMQHAIVRLSVPWSIHHVDATFILVRTADGWKVLWRRFIYFE